MSAFGRRRLLKSISGYFVEVVIIVVGISVSFSVEQWREGRRQHEALMVLTRTLINELRDARKELEYDLPTSAMWIARLDSMRAGQTQPHQLQWLHAVVSGQEFFLFDPRSLTYSTASASSQWLEFPDTIRTRIYLVYENGLDYMKMMYEQQQENVTRVRLAGLDPGSVHVPLLADASHADLQVLNTLLTRSHYQNLLNQLRMTEATIYRISEETIALMTRLEGELNVYLKALEEE